MRGIQVKQRKDIEKFIEDELPKLLRSDQKNCKIVAEADLQSCVYGHIQKFIEDDDMSNWFVLNKLALIQNLKPAKYPDLAIVFLREKGTTVYPTYLIELKEDFDSFNPRKIQKDILKLTKFIEQNNKNLYKTYMIYSVLDDSKTTEEINDKILKMIPNKVDGWIKPITINILGEKTYIKNTKHVLPKIKVLRQYRND